MRPSEQGAARAAPVIHNRIVGKVALFDRVPRGFDQTVVVSCGPVDRGEGNALPMRAFIPDSIFKQRT